MESIDGNRGAWLQLAGRGGVPGSVNMKLIPDYHSLQAFSNLYARFLIPDLLHNIR